MSHHSVDDVQGEIDMCETWQWTLLNARLRVQAVKSNYYWLNWWAAYSANEYRQDSTFPFCLAHSHDTLSSPEVQGHWQLWLGPRQIHLKGPPKHSTQCKEVPILGPLSPCQGSGQLTPLPSLCRLPCRVVCTLTLLITWRPLACLSNWGAGSCINVAGTHSIKHMQPAATGNQTLNNRNLSVICFSFLHPFSP